MAFARYLAVSFANAFEAPALSFAPQRTWAPLQKMDIYGPALKDGSGAELAAKSDHKATRPLTG